MQRITRKVKPLVSALPVRIFAVVNVWYALNSHQPDRAAWPEEQIRDYLRSQSGTHFDPQVLQICLGSGLLAKQ